MCDIIVKYDRKNFFGIREYTEDRAAATEERFKKSFDFFKKQWTAALEIKSVIFCFDSMNDFENDVVLVIKSHISEREYVKMSFRSAKKYAREILMEEGVF